MEQTNYNLEVKVFRMVMVIQLIMLLSMRDFIKELLKRTQEIKQFIKQFQ
jgi:hypothetical protein